MSIAEMKWEMVKTIEHMPDSMISEALEMLKNLDEHSEHSIMDEANLEKHFKRFDNVLKKLAQ